MNRRTAAGDGSTTKLKATRLKVLELAKGLEPPTL
jgi:hypothetical protein